MHYTRRFLLAAGAACAAGPALAQSAAAKGEAIAGEAARRAGGYGDLRASGQMVLLSGGVTSSRSFDARWVETGARSARAVLIFQAPGDIRGTALLTHSFQGRGDEQWLYLPSLAKVRRIASSQRSGSFVGSEFAYEDMTDQEIGNFSHLWIQDGPCPGGGTCHIVERRPRTRSGYSLQRVWFDTGHFRVMQVQYFDRRGAHIKTLRMSNWQLHGGRFWRAGRMDMQNHLTGKATRLTWSGHRFNTGVDPNQLTPNALPRLR